MIVNLNCTISWELNLNYAINYTINAAQFNEYNWVEWAKQNKVYSVHCSTSQSSLLELKADPTVWKYIIFWMIFPILVYRTSTIAITERHQNTNIKILHNGCCSVTINEHWHAFHLELTQGKDASLSTQFPNHLNFAANDTISGEMKYFYLQR